MKMPKQPSTRSGKKTDKKMLTFFLIAFPTVLIILLSTLLPLNSWWMQILLAIYQFIILKQFLDNYYEIL